MKTVKVIILSLASVAFGLTSLGAEAACTSSDIAGAWRVFSVTGSDNPRFQGVGQGTLVFETNGALNTKLSSFTLSNVGTVKFSKGNSTVTNACQVRATAQAQASIGGIVIVFTLNAFDGQMNSNKNVISGVYKLNVPGIGTDNGLYNLIK